MEMKRLNATGLKAAGYDERERKLVIETTTGTFEYAHDIRPTLTLGVERNLKAHAAELVGDEEGRAFFSGRRLVGIERILRLRLACRH